MWRNLARQLISELSRSLINNATSQALESASAAMLDKERAKESEGSTPSQLSKLLERIVPDHPFAAEVVERQDTNEPAQSPSSEKSTRRGPDPPPDSGGDAKDEFKSKAPDEPQQTARQPAGYDYDYPPNHPPPSPEPDYKLDLSNLPDSENLYTHYPTMDLSNIPDSANLAMPELRPSNVPDSLGSTPQGVSAGVSGGDGAATPPTPPPPPSNPWPPTAPPHPEPWSTDPSFNRRLGTRDTPVPPGYVPPTPVTPPPISEGGGSGGSGGGGGGGFGAAAGSAGRNAASTALAGESMKAVLGSAAAGAMVGLAVTGLVGLVTRRGGPVGEGFNPITGAEDIGSSATKAFANPTAAAAMGGLFDKGKSIGKGIQGTLNPVKGIISGKGPLTLASDIMETVSDVENWAQTLRKSTEHLTAFNGTLAVSHLEFERRGMVRSIESGKRIGASSKDMHESLSDLLDEIQPIRDAVTNVTNVILARIMDAIKVVVDLGGNLISLSDEVAGAIPIFGPSLAAILRKMQEGEETTESTAFIRLMRHFQDDDAGRVQRPGGPRRPRRGGGDA